MKHCPRCDRDLPESCYWQGQRYCRNCMADYKRDWQRSNPDAARAIDTRYRERHADEIAERRRERDRMRHAGIPMEVRRLPLEPLAVRVRAYIATQYNPRNGPEQFAADFAARFGRSEESVRAWLARMNKKQKFVTVDMGDEMAVFVGSHPALVWPQEWMTA